MLNKTCLKSSQNIYAILFLLLVFGLTTYSLEAKRNSNSKGDGTGRLTELKEKLNLTDDQVAKLTPILKNHHSQVKSIHDKYKDGGPDERQKMRDEIKTVFDKTYSDAGKILSSDQLAKFKDIIKQNKNTGANKGKGQGKGNKYRNNQ